jgi:hypothetical protein
MPEAQTQEGIPQTTLDIKTGLSLVQLRRPINLADLPDSVPFMFLGDGSSVLVDRDEEKGNIWQTLPWQENGKQARPLPTGIKPGRIYTISKGATWQRVGITPQNKEWLWQDIEEPERLSGEAKADLPIWEEKHYFDDYKTNQYMNEDGYTFDDDRGSGSYSPPEGLKAIETAAHNLPEMRVRNFLVYDPERAETLNLKGSQRQREVNAILKKQGWKFVDTNIARTIWVRSLPHAPKKLM